MRLEALAPALTTVPLAPVSSAVDVLTIEDFGVDGSSEGGVVLTSLLLSDSLDPGLVADFLLTEGVDMSLPFEVDKACLDLPREDCLPRETDDCLVIEVDGLLIDDLLHC